MPSIPSVGLFAGIGGFELGMAPFGVEPVLFCEIEEAARSVLAHWRPLVPLERDINDLQELPPDTVILCCGFPCQDLSQQGLKQGIEGSKSGLVRQVFRLLARRRVPWLVIENVPFMLELKDGTGMAVVTAALEHLGYRWAYRVVDSQFFGVPQRRKRVVLIASIEHDPREVLLVDDVGEPAPDPKSVDVTRQACGFYWSEGKTGLGLALEAVPPLKVGSGISIPNPPAVLLPDGTLGTPDIVDAERLQGLPIDWTRPGDAVRRNGRWRLVGNAITRQVAAWIGERILNPQPYDPINDVPLLTTDKWPKAAWNMGNGRFAAALSDNPLGVRPPPISSFLERPLRPLSERATAGFLSRAAEGRLRFPPGFIERVRAHLDRVSSRLAA